VDIVRRKLRERRHARLRASAPQHRADFIFLFVMQNNHGSDQVGTLRTARCFAVAGGAILFEEWLAFLGGDGVGCGSEAQKIARGAASAWIALPHTVWFLRGKNGNSCENASKKNADELLMIAADVCEVVFARHRNAFLACSIVYLHELEEGKANAVKRLPVA